MLDASNKLEWSGPRRPPATASVSGLLLSSTVLPWTTTPPMATTTPAIVGPSSSNLIIRLKKASMKVGLDNYLTISVADTRLAAYVVTMEETLDKEPTINLASSALRLNETIEFVIQAQWSPGSLVLIDYGDNSTPTLFEQLSMLNASAMSSTMLDLNVKHVFVKEQAYRMSVLIANHISQQRATLNVNIQADLPEFVLDVEQSSDNRIRYLNETITFRLRLKESAGSSPLLIEKITLSLDAYTNRLYENYTFSLANNYSLQYRHNYVDYGIHKAEAILINRVSKRVASASVGVGVPVTNVSAHLINSYVNVGQPVQVYVIVKDGNGYSIRVEFDDDARVTVPWRSIQQLTASPNARFDTNGNIYITYAYMQPGVYTLLVNVSNAFGFATTHLCANVTVTRRLAVADAASSECHLSAANLAFYLNEKAIDANSKQLSIAKGIRNQFRLGLVNCAQDKRQQWTSWTLNRLIEGVEYSLDKYCSVRMDGAEFSLGPNELPLGIYVLRAFIVDKSQPEHYVELDARELHVKSSRLFIGGSSFSGNVSRLELNWNEALEFDFYAHSNDPDNDDAESPLMFDVVCISHAEGNNDDEKSANIERAFRSIEQAGLDVDFDLARLGFNLAFASAQHHIRFYEHNCLFGKHSHMDNSNNNAVRLVEPNGLFRIGAAHMRLNQTSLPLGFRLLMHKQRRVSASGELSVAFNLSSLITVRPSADLDEMSKELDKLQDLALHDPKKALGFLSSFVDVMNARSDELQAMSNASDVNITTTVATPIDIVSEENNKLSHVS
jgi:hypothetical protein